VELTSEYGSPGDQLPVTGFGEGVAALGGDWGGVSLLYPGLATLTSPIDWNSTGLRVL